MSGGTTNLLEVIELAKLSRIQSIVDLYPLSRVDEAYRDLAQEPFAAERCASLGDGLNLLSCEAFGRLAALKIAAEIEPCAEEVITWFTSVRIRELEDLTAQALVAMGRTEAVVDFLISIRDGMRDR